MPVWLSIQRISCGSRTSSGRGADEIFAAYQAISIWIAPSRFVSIWPLACTSAADAW
jgi:hypothetical protein